MVRNKKNSQVNNLIKERPHCSYAKFSNKNALHPIDKIRSISTLL